ncbi:MAG: hypothetical protein IPH09_08005 [bacterium]|nr:hypothetical protein [bacterium]
MFCPKSGCAVDAAGCGAATGRPRLWVPTHQTPASTASTARAASGLPQRRDAGARGSFAGSGAARATGNTRAAAGGSPSCPTSRIMTSHSEASRAAWSQHRTRSDGTVAHTAPRSPVEALTSTKSVSSSSVATRARTSSPVARLGW